jgi:hypothetical protein
MTTKVNGFTSVYKDDLKNKIIDVLIMFPNGINSMSFAIDGLVESSISLGVLSEENNMYRTFISMLIVVFIIKIYEYYVMNNKNILQK